MHLQTNYNNSHNTTFRNPKHMLAHQHK